MTEATAAVGLVTATLLYNATVVVEAGGKEVTIKQETK
jgi:hypothetical protein